MNALFYSFHRLSDRPIKALLLMAACLLGGLGATQAQTLPNCPSTTTDNIKPAWELGFMPKANRFYHKDGTFGNTFFKDEVIYSYAVTSDGQCKSPSGANFRTPNMPPSFVQTCTAVNISSYWDGVIDDKGQEAMSSKTCQKIGPITYVYSRAQRFQATTVGEFTITFANSGTTTVTLTILERYAVYTDCGNLAGTYNETGTRNGKKKFVDSDGNELYYDDTNARWVISGSTGIAYGVASTADIPPLTGWQNLGNGCSGNNVRITGGEYIEKRPEYEVTAVINSNCAPQFNGTYKATRYVDGRPVLVGPNNYELKYDKTLFEWRIGGPSIPYMGNRTTSLDVPSTGWYTSYSSQINCPFTPNAVVTNSTRLLAPLVMCVTATCGNYGGIYTQTGFFNERPDFLDEDQNRLFYWGMGDPNRPEGWYIADANNKYVYYNSATAESVPTTGWQVFTGDGISCTGEVAVTNSATIAYDNASYCKSATQAKANIKGTAIGTFSSTSGLSIDASTGAINPSTSTAGTYVVTYSIAGGCDATTTVTIDDFKTPSVAIASNDADNSITAGISVTFTATPTNGGTNPTYIWKKNDTVIPNEAGATYTTTTLADGDKIKVEMTSSDACASPATATSSEITMVVRTCTYTPSNITVAYIGRGIPSFSGPTQSPVVYTPNGTFNNAPKWTNQFFYSIRWSGSPNNRWEIVNEDVDFVMAYNASGSITNIPCASTNWVVEDEYGDGIILGGGCGSLASQTVTPSVTIAANPTGSITAGTSVTFTATPTNGGTAPTYVWKKNDTVIPNEAGATYTTNTLANGDKIKVEMTSNAACASPAMATSNELTMTVTIPCTQPTANIGVPSGTKCEGQPITLNTSEGTTYAWAFSAGGSFTSTTGSPATWTPNAGGTYTVSLTVNNGTCTASTSTTISVNSKPTASINRSNATVCSGVSITLSNQSAPSTQIGNAAPPAAGVSWAASGGSFSSSTTSPTNWSASVSGPYNISLTVNNGSCSNTASTTVSVNATPTASIGVPSGTKCEGQPITLNTSEGTTYAWAFSAGGSFTSTTGSPATWTPNAGGTYTVSLTVNNGTCTASTSTSIVVSSKPTASINRSSNTVCAGVSITLSNQSVAITPNTANVANIPPNFSWAVSPGGSFTSTTGSPVTWSSNTTGSYSVTLTVNNGSCSNTASTTVSVNALPSVLTVTGGGEVCPGTSVAVGLASSMSGVMYQLKSGNNNVGGSVPGDGTAISFGNISTAGTYTVVATNSNNCTATMNGSATVTVPNPVGGTASADQNICSGTTPTNNLSLSGNVGNVTKWQRATNANFTGATDISVATTTLTSSTIGNLSTDTWFRAVVQAGTCAPVNSSAVKITILQPHTASINATTIVCTGNAIGLTASPNDSGLTYAWSGPGNFSSTLRTPTRPNATLAMSGAYRLTVARPACGFSSTASVSVIATTPNGKAAPRLRALLINGAVAGLGNVYSVCSGAPVTATIAAISGTSYSWNGPGGSSGVGSLAVTAPPATISAAANANTAGNYTMTIFNGCDRSTTVNFSIRLSNCTSTRLASAEGESTLGLSINLAPNPVRDYLTATIEGVEGQTIQLQLIDAQGRSRQQATVEASEGKAQHRFDLRSLPAGVYLLQAETATQRATKKVIRL